MEIVIETEKQLELYKYWAARFKKEIEFHDAFAKENGLHPIIAKADLEGKISVYDQIVEEIIEYESK